MAKRIFILTTRFFPDDGGVERSVYNLARELSSKFEVHVLATGKKSEESTLEGIHVHRRKPWFTFSGNDIDPFLFFEMLKLIAKADLIITNEPNPFGNALLAKALFLRGKPLIIYYHSDIVRGGIGRLLKWIYRNTFQRILFSRAKLILSTSKRYQEISDTLGPWKHKLGVLPNTIDLKGIAKPREQELREFQEENGFAGKKIILFVGRLIYYKGLEVLLEAFSGVADKDAILVIVGKGNLDEKLRKMALELKIADRVRFMGFVEEEKLGLFYSSAEFLVLPSTYKSEAFGIVLLEAMVRGVPVITTSVSGTGEVAEGAGIIVKPGNKQELAEAIIKLLGDPKLRKELGAKALEKSKLYDSKRVAGELEKRIRELIEI